MSGSTHSRLNAERTPDGLAAPANGRSKTRRHSRDVNVGGSGVPFDFHRLAVGQPMGGHLQPKLVVRRSDDLWEREADANAEKVVRAPDDGSGSPELRFTALATGASPGSGSASVQRQEEEEEEEMMQAKSAGSAPRGRVSATGAEIGVLRGGGRPLASGLRSEMETRFDLDFGRVRIHHGTQAANLAGRIGARAFTSGFDVAFGSGEFRPESREGRRLLAHELTHVVQQNGSVGGAGAVQRKATAAPAVPRRVLDTALKGDDDDVRELTTSKVWPTLDVQPAESATLMQHLLDGATLDEDEQAGIKVLSKAWLQSRIDPALSILGDRGKFPQLLDDYHGAEYRELLTLLSNAIRTRKVKALYLDTFIAMYWLNKAEEEAVVVLLEKSADAEVAALLREKDRSGELRSDIGDDELSRRFETRAEVGVVLTFDAISARLQGIFKVKAKKAIGSKTPAGVKLRDADVKRLLKAAGDELTAVLLDYRKRLKKAVKAGETDEVRKLNGNFETRVKHMLERKKLEFDKELVFNFEFNRHLEDSYGRDWTVDDLNRIDAMLRKIPPEILYANPEFRGVERGRTHPSKGGHADPNTKFIALYGNLERRDAKGTLPHEVGHIVHFGATTEFKDFKKISDWQPLTRAGLTALAKTEGIPEDIDDPLDQHRIKGDDYAYVNHGKHNYRYARYKKKPGHYWRYLENTDFVTSYAETDPQEDFAETFELYLTDPEEAKDEAPKKYDFIHLRIFVRYWLEQQKKRVAKEVVDLGEDRAKKIKNQDLELFVRRHGWTPVRKSLRKAFNALKERKTSAVRGGWLTEPVPLRGSPRATRIKREHMRRTENIYQLAKVLDRRLLHFKTGSKVIELLVPTGMETGYSELAKNLVDRYGEELQKLLRPLMVQVNQGKAIAADPWPELDTMARRFDRALLVMDSYVPYHRRCEKARIRWDINPFRSVVRFGDFDPFATKLIRRFRKGSVAFERLGSAIKGERDDLKSAFGRLDDELLRRALEGKKFRKGALTEPEKVIAGYRSTILRHYRRVKAGKRPKRKKPRWY